MTGIEFKRCAHRPERQFRESIGRLFKAEPLALALLSLGPFGRFHQERQWKHGHTGKACRTIMTPFFVSIIAQRDRVGDAEDADLNIGFTRRSAKGRKSGLECGLWNHPAMAIKGRDLDLPR